MDPTTTFCPNRACPARGQRGQGNIGIHSRKEQRFICKQCYKTFPATKGTVFYRLRTAAELVVIVVTLLAHGCLLQAIVAAFRLDERTVADWWVRAGQQGQAVQEYLVEHPRDLGHVPADEIRVKTQGRLVWMALAMMVRTRVWLAGEVSAQRDIPLIRRLMARVRHCAAHRPRLCCTDGLCASIRASRETFREPVYTGIQGRPRLRPWRNRCMAPVVKRYAQWVEARRVAIAPELAVLALARQLSVERPVGMFTNNPLLLKRHIAEVFSTVPDLFGTRAVSSAELGRSKPAPEAFRRLATRLACTPDEILYVDYVDDDATSVAGAPEAGLSAYRVGGAAGVPTGLAAHGLECRCPCHSAAIACQAGRTGGAVDRRLRPVSAG